MAATFCTGSDKFVVFFRLVLLCKISSMASEQLNDHVIISEFSRINEGCAEEDLAAIFRCTSATFLQANNSIDDGWTFWT